MKLKPTCATVMLGLLALGALSSTPALAQKIKKQAPAQEKTQVRMFKQQNGQLVEIDTLVVLTPEQLAKHKHISEALKKDLKIVDHLIVRPSGTGATSLKEGLSAKEFTSIHGVENIRAHKLTSEDSTKERTVKLKIIKKKNDQYYALDTTLVIPAGVSKMTQVKRLFPEGQSLKALGAKALPSNNLPGLKEFKRIEVVPFVKNDSLRSLILRATLVDSTTRMMNGKLVDKWVTAVNVNGEPKKGHTFYLRKSLSGDSVRHERIMIHSDSLVRIKVDSLYKNKRFTMVPDSSKNINVFRIRTKVGIGEEGGFQVVTPKENETFEIIFLRPSKAEEAAKELKASKSKELKADKGLQVSLFPNPSSGRFTVSFAIDKKSDTRLRVVDSAGRTVLEDNAGMQKGTFSRELNLSKFGRGVYILQILCGKNVRSERVVVQ